MPLIVLDPDMKRHLIARRRELGQDRYDEVWEGDYVMSPLADDLHQYLATRLAGVLDLQANLPPGTDVRAGVNISDDPTNWKTNYRCPDVAVFLADTKATCKGTHWLGGPDFAVEIRSRGDRSRKKLPFYARVGTREVLIIDRNPWKLELYRLNPAGTLASVARCTLETSEILTSEVLPLSFTLEAPTDKATRPTILLAQLDPTRHWRV